MEPNERTRLQRAVARAADALSEHHFVWMIGAAQSHFRTQIEQAEERIVRHTHFRDAPNPSPRRTRAEEIAKAQDTLAEYRAIVAFLQALEDLIMALRVESGARDIIAAIWGRDTR